MADLFGQVLQEASYEGFEFPVSEFEVDEGHDAVERSAYGRAGADIEPTGLRPKRGSFKIPLINDIDPEFFPNRYTELVRTFELTPIGRLTHPTKGTFQAHISSWKESASAEVRNGLFLEVQWVEHNASATEIISFTNAVPQDTPTSAEQRAEDADAAMTATGSTSYTPTAPVVTDALDYLESATRTVSEINASIRGVLDVIDGNLALSDFAPASANAAILALGALKSSILGLQSRYLPDQSRTRIYTVPAEMSVWEVALDAYGDGSLGSLITSANSIPDPLFIAPGTVLTILPRD